MYDPNTGKKRKTATVFTREDAIALATTAGAARMRLRYEKPTEPFDAPGLKFGVVCHFPVVVVNADPVTALRGTVYYTSLPITDIQYFDINEVTKMSAPQASESTVKYLVDLISAYPTTSNGRYFHVESPVKFTEHSCGLAVIAALLGGPIQYYTGIPAISPYEDYAGVEHLSTKVELAGKEGFDIVVPTANAQDLIQMTQIRKYGFRMLTEATNPVSQSYQAVAVRNLCEMLMIVPVVYKYNYKLEVTQDPARIALRAKLKTEHELRNQHYAEVGLPPILYSDLEGNTRKIFADRPSTVIALLEKMRPLVETGDISKASAQGLANAYIAAVDKNDLSDMFEAAKAIAKNYKKETPAAQKIPKPKATIIRRGETQKTAPVSWTDRLEKYRESKKPPGAAVTQVSSSAPIYTSKLGNYEHNAAIVAQMRKPASKQPRPPEDETYNVVEDDDEEEHQTSAPPPAALSARVESTSNSGQPKFIFY